MQQPKRVYLSPPDLSDDERRLLIQAFESNWITTLGPAVDAFEGAMCDYLGIKYAAALTSGTAALHLALINLGVGPGDVVICSDLTFVASANPVTYVGARPVFIDSARDSWNMDPDLLEHALDTLAAESIVPRAAVVVDLYGQSADYGRILEICNRHGVPVIEDAAEALGATYRGTACGRFGEMGILSFNGNKIITTSGGGMLVSDNPDYIKRARHLATQAKDPFPYYHHTAIGYNYRLSNLLAAIGVGQLEAIDRKVERRREINRRYREALGGLRGIAFMPELPGGRSSFWLTCMTVDPVELGVSNEELRLHLEALNIESRHVWKPMHLQPIFTDCRCFGGEVSADLFHRGLCLPSGSGMSTEDLERVIHAIKERVDRRETVWVRARPGQ
jgi:dTDP-4-amino-4,6-dideoxygalactose transaminase